VTKSETTSSVDIFWRGNSFLDQTYGREPLIPGRYGERRRNVSLASDATPPLSERQHNSAGTKSG